jgi:hypothetical protein
LKRYPKQKDFWKIRIGFWKGTTVLYIDNCNLYESNYGQGVTISSFFFVPTILKGIAQTSIKKKTQESHTKPHTLPHMKMGGRKPNELFRREEV